MHQEETGGTPEFDQELCEVFTDCDDWSRRKLTVGGATLYAYSLDGLVASSDISDFVLRPLAEGLLHGSMQERYAQALGGALYNAVAAPVEDVAAAAQKLVNGFCVLLFPSAGAVAFEVKSSVKRGPTAPEVENTVKGAKDAFTETMRINTSLVRRHLRTPDLRLRRTLVGARSLTGVTVCSVEGLTDPAMVERVQTRLAEIDIDGLLSPAAVEEYLTGSRKTAFPLLQYTERTDRFAQGLLDGRVGVLVDGLPLGYLLPVDAGYLMTSPEDQGTDYLSASVVRLLRWAALLLTLLLPGLYISIAMFQPEMLPTPLLKAIIESKENVPFSSVAEVLGLLMAFELLQQAGLHLPQAIGQSVSIIGGLVVGTAAVDASLVSPAALIVAAAAGICGFVLPSRDFSEAIRLWRLILTVCAACAGLFGLTAGTIALLIRLSGLTSLDRPYLGHVRLLRPRLVTEKYRDPILRAEDLRKQR
ncbi:MAG: spore germination protein [Oscillospiraceae bacterium]|nr:spore germination protein [Oscillospiraceae bacterium]